MGGLWARIAGDKSQPIKGPLPRLKNIVKNNFRGIIGVIVPIAALAWQPQKNNHAKSVECMWLWMLWFYLVLPMPIPCTSMIPIFLLPMAGVYNSMDTCKCYFNENIALFILSSMVLLLLNNSGFDRRIAIKILTSGDSCQFSGKRLVFKCSLASFILSMFSNKLIVTSTLTQYITPIFMDMRAATIKSATEPNFDELRYIVNNAIQTSSNLGSIAILHSSYATLLFRAIWCEVGSKDNKEFPDIFNYLQYTAFALPVAFLMFVFNFVYHMMLVNLIVGKPMSASSMTQVRNAIMKHIDTIPKSMTGHEKLTVWFSAFFLAVLFGRFVYFGNNPTGWAVFNLQPEKHVPVVKDAVVAAIFLMALHILPKSCMFLNFVNATKKSELKNVKPESAILWWRFVDKNTNYGYIFVFGAGVAIYQAVMKSELCKHIVDYTGKNITNQTVLVAVLIVCIITTILANVISGVAVVVTFLPFILSLAANPEDTDFKKKIYQPALGVGIASSFGFALPFLYTPAYFCHHTGKVPVKKMIMYSALSALVCCILLWVALSFYAPVIFGDSIELKDSPLISTQIAQPKEPEEGGGGDDDEGGGDEG